MANDTTYPQDRAQLHGDGTNWFPTLDVAPGGLTVNSAPVTTPLIVPLTASDVSKAVFIADRAYVVTGVKAVFGTASASGTLNVEKLTGTTAAGSGTAMLTGTLSLSGTPNTVLSGTLTGTTATLTLAAGDRIGVVLAGTLTSLATCHADIYLRPV